MSKKCSTIIERRAYRYQAYNRDCGVKFIIIEAFSSITMSIENLIRRDIFRLKLVGTSAAKYLCFSLGTPCRGVRAKKETGEEEDCRRSRDPRKSAILGPGGPPSICCSYCFRHKYPPRMYWILPLYASYLLSNGARRTGRLFSARYFTRVT